jgi:Putative prokaryotic signal transducing protein
VISVYKPQTLIQLTMAESLLMANDIPYYVHNQGYGGLYPGMQLDLLNVRTVMVPPSAVEAAREILAHYLSDEPGFVPRVGSGKKGQRMNPTQPARTGTAGA